ncbi:hypothetical protein MGG_16526 [Pyricularia oryzae 70-15]|uniref:Uncharacterized protein n=4 Tax=Pyricularia oryzae TaxID=318829 RepID=G4MKK7_PYRO7|nr:uncharacterized protein MGG_16526 [Pyricularia oryzae 70-15]ELQ33078.1 hypothetical protein OOU_Y34scaffold01005g104 [Pyricularia oryzae Y34]KAI7912343.1 hypothetical protein M0657_010500 [Pyricularia oryzae]EHA58390.1 hypothetical protein MGG_16526 [Pyricularia oryzae 70-15]KAI7927981.1 hypothetical protein M9X92_002045 [Pyricularia oryzae]QBZ63484.1 hypothetical protein PoMZ_05166 [Pyricularia oryzae]
MQDLTKGGPRYAPGDSVSSRPPATSFLNKPIVSYNDLKRLEFQKRGLLEIKDSEKHRPG